MLSKKGKLKSIAGLDSSIESQSELYTKYGIITKYDVQVQETDERTGKKKMVTKQKSNNVHALIGSRWKIHPTWNNGVYKVQRT